MSTLMGAKNIQTRKRHPEFPISTGDDYDYAQPTSIVHADFTMGAILEMSQDVLNMNNSDYNRIQCLKSTISNQLQRLELKVTASGNHYEALSRIGH